MPVTITQLEGLALSGTPADGSKASANPGQTIRLHGAGVSLSTEVIFPIVDVNGTISNRVLRPDYAGTDGTLAEIRVPDDAITGNVQVVGAAGTFLLQIVPTLTVVERFSATDVRLMGGGFSEDHNLSVTFGLATVADTGSNVDVYSWFLANDYLTVIQPGGSGNTVTVTTAGGTSAPVNIGVDDPGSAGAMLDLAIFPGQCRSGCQPFCVGG